MGKGPSAVRMVSRSPATRLDVVDAGTSGPAEALRMRSALNSEFSASAMASKLATEATASASASRSV
ncbi:MAG TPA: hypothetical protein VIT65_18265 [Microlunatus sp.]